MDRRRLRGSSLLGFLLTVASTAYAAAPQVAWKDLPQRVAHRLIPLEKLGVRDCPKDLALREPNRRVLQVIESLFYSWEEYDLGRGRGAPFCIVMRRPVEQALAVAEAQVLLSASALWEGDPTEEPSDKRGAQAGEPVGVGPVVRPMPPPPATRADGDPGNLDRGIAGWAPPPGKSASPSEPESPRRSFDKSGIAVSGSVLGTDDRRPVTNTRAFPFNVVSYLGTNAGRGTGFLVSPYMTLTNGHMVWDDGAESFVSSMLIAPGQIGASNYVVQPKNAVRFATNVGWVTTRRIEYDYSAAFVDTPFPGIATFMPLVFDVAPGPGGIVNIAGYPGEAQGAETFAMWLHTDKVTAVQGRILRYSVDTSPGNSGSPVWETFSATGQRRAIAVHAAGDPELKISNSGSRLVFQNFDLISEWMQWTPQTRNGLNLSINQTEVDDCPLVRLAVTVTDNAGNPVADLTRGNFTVLENGVRQSISLSQGNVGDAPVAVTLVLDASGSLSDTDVANIKAAARGFVDLLGPRDRVAVYHFANGVARAQSFTADKVLARAAVNALNNDGGVVGDGGRTALFDAIIEAAGDTTTTGRRALVVMTDGMNNTGSGTQATAIQAARSAGVPVFTIGFGGVDRFVLDEIARQTGGRFFLGASSADLQAILRAIGRTLDSQYLLSWTTKFISGGTEQVEVRVEDGGQSDQEKISYSQAGTLGCPRPVVGCTVRVDSPKQKDVWFKGTRQTLRWSTSGASCGPAVGLGLSNGSDIFYLGDVEDSGSKTYNIDFLPAGTNYQAIVVNRSSQVGFTGFSGTFEIRVPKALPVCRSGPEVLCLGKGRFLVRALWRTPTGQGGFGKTIPLTADSGAFWFFDSANAELFVKVLDGQVLNSHLWVLTGALTDLQYTLFVTDTTTGQTRVYGNQPGEFVSFADVTAFGPPLESANEGLGAAPEPETAEEDEVRPPPVLPASTNPLWSQLDGPGRLIISSEDRLEPGGDPVDTEAADDFVIPAKASWSIDGVDVGGAYFGNGPRGPAASVNVVIYADKQGKPGAVQCSNLRLQPRAGRASGAFEIDLPKPCKLGAGRFWLAVRANINFTTAGQWGWSERAKQRERPSVWRNPGNGYATACRNFGPRLTTCKVGESPDFLFRLRGQVVSGGGGGGGSCKSAATTLCLGGKRFKVEVSFKNTSAGKPAAARAGLHSATTGYFWFFNAANPEVAVKILDGRAFNGRFWIFYGGLTDREFTLKVTDTVTGATKSYSNRAGRFVSAGDIEALPGF